MEKNITLIRNKSLVLDEIILQKFSKFGTFLDFWNTISRTEINDCVTNSKMKNGKT